MKGLSFCVPEWVPHTDEVAEGLFAAAKLTQFLNDSIIRRRFAEADAEADADRPSDSDGGDFARTRCASAPWWW